MAVCGLLSMLCVSPIQPDMDSCPSNSFGVNRNHLIYWLSDNEARAPSCLSSTMVDRNDPDDSESSEPPTPSRDSKQSVIRDPSLPCHELELSISSLNDAQRITQASIPQRFRPVKEEFDPTSASTVREDTLGGSGGGEEETTVSGPPRKRARMSPLGYRLEESQTGNVREQLQRHASFSATSDVTGVHVLMPSRSLPSSRSNEGPPSPGPSRGVSGGSKPTTSSWWLAPRNTGLPNEAQHSQSIQDLGRANSAVEARGMISGTSLQERDFLFKEPSFFPNMLSNMETTEHVRRGEDVPSTFGARVQEQGRPQGLLDPLEHAFFSRKESSTSRVSSTSTVSEETLTRPGITFFSKGDALLQEGTTAYGHQIQHPLEGGGKSRHPSGESQHGGLEREHSQGGFCRPPMDQMVLQPPPSGNASTNFYARILDAAQPVSSPFSQAGFGGAFNPGMGFNLAGQSLPRGVGPVQFGGETANPSVVQQQVNSELLRNLLAAHPTIGSLPPYMPPAQTPEPVRLSFPSLSSLDFLQSLQRQTFPQVSDRFRQPTVASQVIGGRPMQQDFTFLGMPSPPSHHGLSPELNSSLQSRGGQSSLPTSTGLREFLSPQAAPTVGVGRGPAIGGHAFSSALELPTNLSLQAPGAPPPLTVVMEGRSIGRRISLQEYDSYESFAAAMRTMFESNVSSSANRAHGENCTLANAIPGFVIAYEDEEGDVLLAGDLPWRDFVRVAKQIRIVSSSKLSFKPPTGPSRS